MTAIEVQYAEPTDSALPSQRQIQSWVEAALGLGGLPGYGLTVRVVGCDEIARLNGDFRKQPKPTNVLAFPFAGVAGIEDEYADEYAGDVVICWPVVQAEAAAQGLAARQHFARMVIHGTLHLCGFDHQLEQQAQVMEALENRILAAVGFMPPGVSGAEPIAQAPSEETAPT